MNVPIAVRRELEKVHDERSQDGLFRDLTKATKPDFLHDFIAKYQAAKGNESRITELHKTVLQDSDFGETYDLAIDIPGGFWDKIVALTQSLANVQAVSTSAHKIQSNELTLGSNGEDIFRPGVEGTDPGDTGTLDTDNREFIPEEAIAIWGLTDHVLEDNIEKGTLESHVMGMMEKAAANELSKAIWNGTKVGTANSSRGSITGMFDGFVQQCNDAGNVIYGTSYEDRYVTSIQENDKFLAAIKEFPEKYGTDGLTWMTKRGIIADWNAELYQRETGLGDTRMVGGYWAGLSAQGVPMFDVPAMRSDYLVKATGTVQASSPLDTQLAAIGKARATTVTTDDITNAADAQVHAIGCDAAGTSFNLNAEYLTQSGTPSGTTLTYATALARDHAIDEYVTEFSTAPTKTGIPCLLTSWDNLKVYYQRVMRIEPYRLPRTRATFFIMTTRLVPIVVNPDKSVLIRDLAVR